MAFAVDLEAELREAVSSRLGGGPSATEVAASSEPAPATISHRGGNTAAVSQSGRNTSGEALAGSQRIEIVSDGSVSVEATNVSSSARATSGDATSANIVGAVTAGPRVEVKAPVPPDLDDSLPDEEDPLPEEPPPAVAELGVEKEFASGTVTCITFPSALCTDRLDFTSTISHEDGSEAEDVYFEDLRPFPVGSSALLSTTSGGSDVSSDWDCTQSDLSGVRCHKLTPMEPGDEDVVFTVRFTRVTTGEARLDPSLVENESSLEWANPDGSASSDSDTACAQKPGGIGATWSATACPP